MKLSSGLVTSKDNPSIKLFRKLMISKKERNYNKLFALEGSRLVFDAVENNAPVDKLFVTETAAVKFERQLKKYKRIPAIYISDQLGGKISDTNNTQGIFAQCRFLEGMNRLGDFKRYGKYAVLSRIQDPGNMGMIIRTADAMGLDGVILSGSCDIYNPKVVRSTMGSLFRVPVFHGIDEEEIFLKFNEAEIPSFAAVVDNNAKDLKTADFSKGGGIFIGNEGNGLSEETVSKCTEKITIKMNGNIDSLNAAMATGIIMWELMK